MLFFYQRIQGTSEFLFGRCAVLKSYEAVYDHGDLKWVGDQPPDGRMKVIVTVIEEEESSRQAALLELLERARGCVRPRKSVLEIDADLKAMRAQWNREWDA